MNPGDWIFFAIVGTLATNHVLIRLPGWEQRSWLFWLVQLMNLSASGFLLAVGLPGFSGNLAVVNYVLALMFIVRAVQNNNRWGARDRGSADGTAEDAGKEAIRDALRRGEAARQDDVPADTQAEPDPEGR